MSDTYRSEQSDIDPRGAVESEQRPWGGFERLAHNVACTVKIITVNPGSRLSLQRHEHRSEFWTVLDGPLVVETDGERRTVGTGGKVWLPCGTVHRVTNEGTETGRFLEIAYGDFDENDIERLEDDYSRS